MILRGAERDVKQAAEEGDIGSRTLFERIALEEESHMAWLDLQLNLIKRLGEQVYAAKFVGPAGDETDASP